MRRAAVTPGDKIGSLTVVRFIRDDRTSGGQKRPVWLFRCDCGGQIETRIYSVTSGKTRSCGCLRGQAGVTHGASRGGNLAPEYKAWRCMLTRAKNPRIHSAKHYSERGIGVCPEWDSGGDGRGFERFLAHIGAKPAAHLSVDRIDNDRGYEPGNVRWATGRTQGRNKSDNRLITHDGLTLSLTEWAERCGIKPAMLRDRIIKLGWTVERALTQPARRQGGS